MREATAAQVHHLHVPAGRGRRLRVMTEVVEIKLTEADTSGTYTMAEVWTPVGGGAAALHTHPPQETFYVLEGIFEFGGVGPAGPYTVRGTPGSVVQIPGGAPHGFRNIGDGPGRVLVIYEPPGKMLSFFETMHAAVNHPDPLTAPPEALPSAEQIADIFAAHDMIILPPAAASAGE